MPAVGSGRPGAGASEPAHRPPQLRPGLRAQLRSSKGPSHLGLQKEKPKNTHPHTQKKKVPLGPARRSCAITIHSLGKDNVTGRAQSSALAGPGCGARAALPGPAASARERGLLATAAGKNPRNRSHPTPQPRLRSPASRAVLLIHPDCFNWLIKQLTLHKTTTAAGVLGNKMRIRTAGLLWLTTAFIIIIT